MLVGDRFELVRAMYRLFRGLHTPTDVDHNIQFNAKKIDGIESEVNREVSTCKQVTDKWL